jgi:hypothetical protein
MDAIKAGWDNIKHGIIAAWTALTPENRSFFSGMGLGAVFGAGFVWLLF